MNTIQKTRTEMETILDFITSDELVYNKTFKLLELDNAFSQANDQ